MLTRSGKLYYRSTVKPVDDENDPRYWDDYKEVCRWNDDYLERLNRGEKITEVIWRGVDTLPIDEDLLINCPRPKPREEKKVEKLEQTVQNLRAELNQKPN